MTGKLIPNTVYRVHHSSGMIDWKYTHTEHYEGHSYMRAHDRHCGINLASGREVILKSTQKIKGVA